MSSEPPGRQRRRTGRFRRPPSHIRPMTQPPAAPNPQEDLELRRLEQRLEAARKELLETTTRTRLLHTPLGSSRAKIVEVRDELAEEVFRALVEGGKAMSFLPAPGDADEEADETVELA